LRGETPHFDHLSSTVTKGLGAIGLEAAIPVINGVLTCNSMEQAVDRAGLKTGNKGFDASMAAIEMVALLKQL
jgi:6,7-dimethyl-8-ribityllumazine synthase